MTDDAWETLDPAREDHYWNAFQDRFHFRPSIRSSEWPAIDEPSPSVTIDLGPIYANEGPTFAAGEAAINSLVLRALTWSFDGAQRFVVLDWQHPCYWFWPHRHAVQQRGWQVTPFPNGDYYIFLTDDLHTGTFGHPWEQTLCVFGQRLIESLVPTLAAWLPIKRSRR